MTNTTNTSNAISTAKKPWRLSLKLLIVSAVCFFVGILTFVILTLIMGAFAPFKSAALAIGIILIVFLSFDIAFLGFIGMAVCGVIELINMTKKPQGKPAAAADDIAPGLSWEAGASAETAPGHDAKTVVPYVSDADPGASSEPGNVVPAGKKPKKKLPVQLVIIMVLMGLQGLCGAVWVILWNIGLFSQMTFHIVPSDTPFYLPAMTITFAGAALCTLGEIACGIWLAVAHFAHKK